MGYAARGLTAALLASLPALVPVASEAQVVERLSTAHTKLGVSQFWAGDTNGNRNVSLRLRNPNRRDHVAVALFYERVNEDDNEEAVEEQETVSRTEVFTGCTARRLTPHSSISVSGDVRGANRATDDRVYAEIVAVPVRPVRLGTRKTRLANGLGIVAAGGGSNENLPFQPLYPRLFSLPSNKVVEGQRQEAIKCICVGLILEDVPTNALNELGVDCPI